MNNESGQGPKYILNIEGNDIPWDDDTITTEQIAELGGWDISQGVIEVDKDNNERTLQPGEIIEIKPGIGFGKKHRWKRGDVRPRITDELEVLRKIWGEMDHVNCNGDDWFLIHHYKLPPGWFIENEQKEEIPVSFLIVAAYPGAQPYGFLTPIGLNCKGQTPKNISAPSKAPPFDGQWVQFSWQPETWAATADIHSGSNLLAWSRSFGHRFREGV